MGGGKGAAVQGEGFLLGGTEVEEEWWHKMPDRMPGEAIERQGDERDEGGAGGHALGRHRLARLLGTGFGRRRIREHACIRTCLFDCGGRGLVRASDVCAGECV